MPRARMYIAQVPVLSRPPKWCVPAPVRALIPRARTRELRRVQRSLRGRRRARNVQLDFPQHDATAGRNSLTKARFLSRALHDFERALTAESEVHAGERVDGSWSWPRSLMWMRQPNGDAIHRLEVDHELVLVGTRNVSRDRLHDSSPCLAGTRTKGTKALERVRGSLSSSRTRRSGRPDRICRGLL